MTRGTRPATRLASIGALFIVIAASGCGHGQKPVVPKPLTTDGWATRLDGTEILSRREFARSGSRCDLATHAVHIEIDPNGKQHEVSGFGAALTESSAVVMKALPEAQRKELLSDLFSDTGLRLNMLRIPIGATDFSLGNYTCDDPPQGVRRDPKLQYFSFGRCFGNILPALKEIHALRPDLALIGTPWTAPSWMKTRPTLFGGELKRQYFGVYSDYLIRFVKELEKEGFRLDYLTVDNEPVKDQERVGMKYPWMIMSRQDQATLIRDHLGPAMIKAGLYGKTKLLLFDHNWMDADYPLYLLKDKKVRDLVSGTALHCYMGSPVANSVLNLMYPDLGIYLTECTSGEWSPKFGDAFAWGLKNVVIRNFNFGSRSAIYWNLVLDQDGGPKNGGCVNCRGLYRANLKTGALERTPEYHVLAQAVRAVDVHSRVLKTFMRDAGPNGIESLAVQNPDLSYGMILLNPSRNPVEVLVDSPRGCLKVPMSAQTALSVRW